MDRSMDWFEEMLLGRIQRDYLTLNESWLVESQGLSDEIGVVIDEIVRLVENEKGVYIDKDLYVINLQNIVFKNVSFLSQLKELQIYISNNSPKESYLAYSDDINLHLDNTSKLINMKIVLYCDERENQKGYADLKDLQKVLYHELQHMFRYHKLLTNHGDLNANAKEKQILQKAVQQNASTKSITKEQQVKEVLRSLYYMSNLDEIKAFCTEGYRFVLDHEEVTKENINNYISKIPYYKRIQQLKESKGFVEYVSDNFPNCLIEVYSELFNKTVSVNIAKKIYLQRLVYAATFAEKKFYQLIGKALDEVSNGRLMKEGKIYNISCPKIYLTLDKYMSKYSKLWNR